MIIERFRGCLNIKIVTIFQLFSTNILLWHFYFEIPNGKSVKSYDVKLWLLLSHRLLTFVEWHVTDVWRHKTTTCGITVYWHIVTCESNYVLWRDVISQRRGCENFWKKRNIAILITLTKALFLYILFPNGQLTDWIQPKLFLCTTIALVILEKIMKWWSAVLYAIWQLFLHFYKWNIFIFQWMKRQFKYKEQLFLWKILLLRASTQRENTQIRIKQLKGDEHGRLTTKIGQGNEASDSC